MSVAETLICTLNETTLAIGASVPTTNDEPVGVVELVLEEVVLLPHPTARNEAIAKAAKEVACLPNFEMNIPELPRFLRMPVSSRSFSRDGLTASEGRFLDFGLCSLGSPNPDREQKVASGSEEISTLNLLLSSLV